MSYASEYRYLGAWFTDSGKSEAVVSRHETTGEAVVNKFSIFCATNTQMPFIYKKLVFDAAVMSSLLYSAESWLTNKTKSIEKQYNKLVKCLLGVRRNTSINLCMVEAGIPPLQSVISKKRKSFMISKRVVDMSEPFHLVYHMCREANTPGFRFIQGTIIRDESVNPVEKVINYIRENSQATKMNTYVTELNSPMTVHNIYNTKTYIPDYMRESFTRLRVMSHSLRVEVGRWSRTPRQERVCQCDNTSIQTEQHVLIQCHLSQICRDQYPMLNFNSITDLLQENVYLCELCRYVHEVLNIYG